MAGAVLDGKIYVSGGATAAAVLSSVIVYDPGSGQWTQAPPMLTPRLDHRSVALGGRLYVIGGRTANGGALTRSVTVFDPVSGTWTEREPMPDVVNDPAVATFDGKIYLFGGDYDGNTLGTTFIYDPEQDSWSAGAPLPVGTSDAAAASIGSTIYVVGGASIGTAIVGGMLIQTRDNLDVVQAYSPNDDTWTARAPLTIKRNAGVAALNNRLYAFGGAVVDNATGGASLYSTAEVYSPGANAWSPGPDLPRALSEMVVVALGGRIHLLGGFSDGWTNQHWTFQPVAAILGAGR